MRRTPPASGYSRAKVALNYLLAKPGVSSVLIGARNEAQLNDNLGAAEWKLNADEIAVLDRVSDQRLPSPYNRQAHYGRERNPYWTQAGRSLL